MLVVEDLRVEVGGREILKGVDLVIGDGERHVLFGPNGSGKSTLLMTIMGFPNYRVKSGRIEFNGVDITDMPVNERAKLGIALAYQHPPSIRGVRLEDMIKICSGKEEIGEKERELLEKLKISPDFLKRDVNSGFSGGEVKRSEILQLLLMKPKLAMMDEPDSGVDVENIEVVGNAINELLKGRSG
ncbi:MAG: ABC transporter ATP-binding protein, partial [Archaeoglobi archaeon]|nr:ABC transporter ATP-binding protein [Candidatus Mnemosynella sp.]